MGSGFSDREVQLMACAFQAMKSPPEIDYNVMAKLAGMSNPGSASNAMRAIRRKLDARLPGGTANGNSTPSTPKKTPRTAGGKKRTAADIAAADSFFDQEEAGAVDSTPSKKKGKGGKAKAVARGGGGASGDGGENDTVRVKREKIDGEVEDDVVEHELDVEEV